MPDPGLEYSAVVLDRDAETSSAENGTESSGVDPYREGELKTGPLRTDSSGSGTLASTANAALMLFLRLRRMMRATAAMATTAQATAMPAMAPALRPELSDEDGPSLAPVESESIDVIVTIFSCAPWFHRHADTLNTLRS